MTQRNPWVDSATSTDVRDRATAPGEDWRDWLPTGPVAPQPYVSVPEDALPVRRTQLSAGLWVVGAHGGAGESTLADLADEWRPAEHAWPELDWGAAAPCVIVARTNARGLLAARTALTQWAASGAGESARLLGLVLVADAPGKLPGPLRDLAKVVGGGAPRVWSVSWVEAWRLGEPSTEFGSRPVSKLVSHLRSLAASAAADAELSNLSEEQSS